MPPEVGMASVAVDSNKPLCPALHLKQDDNKSSQTEGKAHTRYCASVQEDQATDKDIKASDNTTHVPSVERTRFELDLIKIKTELATTTTATSVPHSAGC